MRSDIGTEKTKHSRAHALAERIQLLEQIRGILEVGTFVKPYKGISPKNSRISLRRDDLIVATLSKDLL